MTNLLHFACSLYTAHEWGWGAVQIGYFLSALGGAGTLNLLIGRRMYKVRALLLTLYSPIHVLLYLSSFVLGVIFRTCHT